MRPGRKGEKGATSLFVGQNCLIKGQHGDTQIIFMAIFWGCVDKFDCLTADETHVLLDQGVRRLGVAFGLMDLGRDVLCRPHHFDPSIPFSRRIRNFCWISGVVFPVLKRVTIT